jgi:flagellar biosynthetic protein FliR
MEWVSITPHGVQQFFFIFLRVTVVLFFVPIFGSRMIPIQVKTALSLIISFALFSFLLQPDYNLPWFDKPLALILAIAREVMLGMTIGFAARLIFAALQLGGQVISFQMGYGMVNILDPISQTQSSIMVQWTNLLLILVFLATNAHHWFIRAITKSFELIPIGGAHFPPSLTENLVYLSSNIFVISLKIMAPVIAALLFTKAALGIIARTVPQMNIFIIAFPLQIAVGLFIFGLTLPFMVGFMSKLAQGLGADIWQLLALMEK